MTRESEIERYLCTRVRALGGETRKITWIGRRGAPDRLVFLGGGVMFIELKAPGRRPSVAQTKELERLRDLGARAVWASSRAEIDALVEAMMTRGGES